MLDDTFTLTSYENIVDPTTNDDGEKIQFKYEELPPHVQERVLNNEDRDPSYDWWDDTYEHATEVAEYLGISIDARNVRGSPIGVSHTQPDINFSGFCSQGDGACFNGQLNIAMMEDGLAKLEANGINDVELIAFATRAKDVYNEILAEETARRIIGNEDDHNLYWIDTSSTLTIRGQQRGCFTTAITDEDDYENAELASDLLDEFVSDFADYIYSQLEKEYDYLTSDAYVIEGFTENNVLFDESGVKL